MNPFMADNFVQVRFIFQIIRQVHCAEERERRYIGIAPEYSDLVFIRFLPASGEPVNAQNPYYKPGGEKEHSSQINISQKVPKGWIIACRSADFDG